MSIVITGATGHLGGLVVDALLARGVEPGHIVATGRNPDRLDALSELGVRVAAIDHDDRDSVRPVFTSGDRVLLVSGPDVGRRLEQHRNVISAAVDAGAELLAYTSILHADTSSLLLAVDHRATEEVVRESGLPFVLLRNGWYLENYSAQLPVYLHYGIAGSAGDGRISAASRADYAEAAAVMLTANGHEGATYELGGDQAFTMAELADEISRQAGTSVAYHDMPVDAYTEVLVGAGLPPEFAAVLADGDRGVGAGELLAGTDDLRRLIGRPTTTLSDAIRAALSSA